ncbi:MAG: hypothetical protein G3M78_10230 [Candidatus Nitrohelix vancouverensis]|uniref:SGNH hydrolase-type esterase domain-containing protein n=1 Tax=Candidatus Nitrohelix vancouverensis TaxID=2705534 RepID=A0A7T0G3X9_9BACT|nr:MAG: hypothetical protein G3M78_10230 [Candidatus Nitrohelix vancouverensis]
MRIIYLLFFILTASPVGATPVNVAALGDSYVSGEGLLPEEGWPEQLIARVEGVEFSGNLAVSGAMANEVLQDQIPGLNALRPDYLLLQVGVNDWMHSASSKTYRKRLRRLLDAMQDALVDKNNILLVTAPLFSCSPARSNWGYGKSAVNGIQRMNRILMEEASLRHLAVVDIFDLSRQLCSGEDMFADDGLHPSARQYTEWTNLILPEFLKLLADDRR